MKFSLCLFLLASAVASTAVATPAIQNTATVNVLVTDHTTAERLIGERPPTPADTGRRSAAPRR